MEIWIDPANGELKAVYSDRYRGTVWQAAGYEKHEYAGTALPRDLMPGARVDLTGPAPVVTLPAPPPPPDPKAVRLEVLRGRLKGDTITDAEIREMLRLERGL